MTPLLIRSKFLAPGAPEAVLVRDGRIARLGSLEQLAAEAQACGAAEWRLPPEALVVPGLVDAHLHLISTGMRLGEVNLAQAPTPEAAARLLARAAEGRPAGEWVLGRGWRPDRWSGFPESRALDEVLPERPVAASAFDGHTLWVNRAALRLCGIAQGTPDPEGGRIRRDAAGQPSGVLHENACALVWRRIGAPTRARKKACLREAARASARAGFSGVHDVEDLETLELARELHEAGELPLRVSGMCRPADLDDGSAALWLHDARDSERVRLFALKLFLDGTFTSRTAWMLTPYREGGTGMQVLPVEELDARLRQAARLGLFTAVHVIGDRAVREWLDAVERFRREPDKAQPSVVDQYRGRLVPRMRAEHAQLIAPEDLPRFRALAVAASVQPSHLVPDFPVLLEHFPQRRECAYPFRALLEAGAPVCLSSDAPIMDADPGQCLYAACARRPWPGEPGGDDGAATAWEPGQRLSIEESLACYAAGAAWAEGREERRGALREGLDADFTVFARDPRTLDAGGLYALRRNVLATVVAGEVYEAQAGVRG